MNAQRYLVAAALIVGSVGIGSTATQGSGAVSSVPATPAESQGYQPMPDGPKPDPAPTSSAGYSYFPIIPYRNIDSRLGVDLKLGAGEIIYGSVLFDEFWEQQIPDSAVAVTYNITVTETTGGGFLAVFPADIYWTGHASVNWVQSNQTVGNGGTVAIGYLDDYGQIGIYNGGSGAAHFIIDITGYYE
jgi:hypothetical protein